MTKQELLRVMRLLSALEAIGLMRGPEVPQYFLDEIDELVRVLESEILK
jgi:hypothetical protein